MDNHITLAVSDLSVDMNRYRMLLVMLAGVAIPFFLMPNFYFVMEQRDFLALHTLQEFSCALVAFMMFGVIWNSLSQTCSVSITLLGCALLASSLLDLGHMLSFSGMPDFIAPSSPEKSVAFWLAARLTVAATLCAVSFMSTTPLLKSKIRYTLLFCFSLYTLLIYWLVLFQPIMPLTYADSNGQWAFKIVCEWGIIGLLVIAASRFWKPLYNANRQVMKSYFFTAAMIFIMSEVLYTQHTEETDVLNVLGHLYKITGYFLLYQAVSVLAIQIPYHEVAQQQVRFWQLLEIMNSSGMVYQAVDNGNDFIFLRINPAVERTEKINWDDFTGKRVAELFLGTTDFGLLDVLRRVWRTGQPEHFPINYQDRSIADWREKHLHRLPNGNIAVAYGDLTEHKLAGQTLQEREQHFRVIFESATIGMAEADPVTGKFMRVNLKLCQMTGYSEEELLSKSCIIITHPNDQEKDVEGLQYLARGDIAEYVTEKRYIHKNGHDLWVQLNAIALRDKNGNILRILAVTVDISERNQIIKELRLATYKLQGQQIELEMKNDELHRSHIALEESHDRYVDLYDFAPIGYLSLSNKGVIREINLTGTTLLGISSKKKALGRPIGAFLAPEECDNWHLLNQRTLKHIDKQSCELSMKRADGTVFYALLICQRKNTSTSPMVRVSFTDITERKQLERQLQQSQKMQALGQLTGGVAHDFNNILAVILGYSNLALTRYSTDKESTLTHYLEEITTAGERARDLVTRMMAYSRNQTDEVAEAIAPASLVEEVIKMLASTIPSGIKLQDQIDTDIPAISISPGELHQIVMNLAINARDAMSEHGCIDIRLSALEEAAEFCIFCKNTKNTTLCQSEIRGEYMSLSVTDTGCGISPENFKLIFNPFFSTKDVGKGTGLGLSVVHGIVRRTGGCIVVDSHLGMGSTVQVLLPAADASVDLSPATTSLPTISDGNGARILVVDDEPALTHYLVDLLEGENYVVDAYADSVEALNYFHTNPQHIDAVITDQTMPNKSGIEIANVMLALRPDLPVFLCSGYSDSIDENIQLFGIRRFFTKPINATELLIALNEEIALSRKSINVYAS